MQRLWRNTKQNEAGYVLILTLICMAFGGLIIAATLNYANTMLKARIVAAENMKSLYAAEAGVEDVLACLTSNQTVRIALPQNVNNNQVTMQTEYLGEQSFYAGEWVTAGSHSDWLLIDSNVAWDETAEAYKYTVNVTWNAVGSTTIHLLEVGVQLPAGYEYQPGSAYLFASNLSREEPEDEVDTDGIHFLSWEFPNPKPSVTGSDPVERQAFYITGTGDLDGGYAWVIAAREDIGCVSQLTGDLYKINSVATTPQGATAVQIEAYLMLSMGEIFVLTWKVESS